MPRTKLTLSAAVEIIGYIGRAIAHDNTGGLEPYMIQSLMLLLAPALFAASIYMTLGRVILSVDGARLSIIRPGWLTKLFVLGDVFSFVIQGSGGGLLARGNNLALGQNIILGGLGIQILMFGLFGATAVAFHIRLHRWPTGASLQSKSAWRRQLCVLHTVSALIMTRCVFRVVEYAMGNNGYPLTHEWTLYVFDAVPMLAVMIIFGTWFPSELRLASKWGPAGGGVVRNDAIDLEDHDGGAEIRDGSMLKLRIGRGS